MHGVVSFRSESTAAEYPHPNHEDFVGVILGWWAQSLTQFLGGEPEVGFLFMDGPYSLSLREGADGAARLSASQPSDSGAFEGAGVVVSPSELARSVLGAVALVDQEYSRGGHPRDTDWQATLLAAKALQATLDTTRVGE